MRNTYPITQEQIEILNTFTCERLTDSTDNLQKIQNFQSYRGRGLVNSLRSYGWEADRCGSVAYYVIKNPQGRILMFFSLKCGALFDPHYVQRCAKEFDENKELWISINRARTGDESALDFLKKLKAELGDDEYRRRILAAEEDYYRSKGVYQRIKWDKREEPNPNMIRVDQSHSAVELVEFCVNDRTKGCWDDLFCRNFATRRNTMGKVFFWWFIVPKMIEISRLVGCEYAYLFAADESPDGNLVRYYEDALHFRKLTHLGTVKPYYDLSCYFMGRRIFSIDEESVPSDEVVTCEDDLRGLEYYRDQFFANFNLRLDADDLI